MALISSKDKLIQNFNDVFEGLEQLFDTSSPVPAYGGHGVQVTGPPVAQVTGPPPEYSKGFVQMFEEMDGLKDSEYAQTAMQYLPVIIGVGKSLLPYLKAGSPELFLVLQHTAFIGIGLACFAELVILKQIIENDCSSSGAAAKELLQDTLEYTSTRIQRNHQRFADIEEMIEKAKVETFQANSKDSKVLLIRLQEKMRVCKIDISECMQKTKELYTEIESTIAAFSIKLKRSAWAAAGLGTLALAGTITAAVATGGLVIAAGVIAGATGVATGGLSYRAKLCGDYKHDFIVMKARCDTLLKDVKRLEDRLKLHVKELQDSGIAVEISLTDFD